MSSFDEPPAAPADHQDSFHWHYAAFDDNYRISRQSLFFFVAVFALLLVLFVFALYLRWVCRFRAERDPHAPPHMASEAQLGLQPTVIDSYPIVLHAVGSGGDAECCICLSGFQEGEKVKVLPECRHRFHADCVDKWLRTHSSCPLCRVSLRFDSAV